MLTLFAAAALTLQADTPPVLQRMLDCRTVEDRDARLTCFDREAGTVARAQQAREIVVLNRERARRGTDAGPDEPIETTIAAATESADGRWAFRLADGTRWRQIDGSLAFAPRPNEAIRIRPAAMGSYLGRIGNRPGIRLRFLGRVAAD